MIRKSSEDPYNNIKTKFIIIFLNFDNVASHKKCTQRTKRTGWSILQLDRNGAYKLRVVKVIDSLKYSPYGSLSNSLKRKLVKN